MTVRSRLIRLRWLLCLVLVAGPRPVSAAAALTGTVVDPLGGVVPGATVVLVQGGHAVGETTSDARGAFAFSPVAPGPYRIEVRASGFEPVAIDAVVSADAPLVVRVALQIGPFAQQLVVTAAATELPASRVGAPVTVIDRPMLESLGTPDVLDALRLVPGLQVVQTGGRGGTTSVFTRGGNATFNKVLVDGVPVNDIGGAFEFANLATAGLERVEILRGPNSVLFGTDALTGVVSLTTRRGQTRVPEATYAADGGNLGTLRQALSAGGIIRRLDYFSEVSQFDTDNVGSNNAFRNRTYAGRVGWAFGGSTALSATVRRSRAAYGVPGALDFYGIANDASQTAAMTAVGLALQTHLTDRWSGSVRLASNGQDYEYVNPAPTGDPFDPFGYGANYLGRTVTIRGANGTVATGRAILDYAGVYPSRYTSHTTRQSLYAQTDYRFTDALEASGGVRVEHEQGFTDSGTRSSSDRRNAGLFGEGRARLWGRHHVTAGVGVERNEVFGTAVTPRVSVASYVRQASSTAAVGDTKLTFNAGTGIKAPSIYYEQSSLFALLSALPHGAALVSSFGVTPIAPERSRSVDAGIEQGLWRQRLRVRAAYFDNTFNDLIEFVSKGALPQVGVPSAVAAATAFGAAVNSSSYRARGVETSLDARIGRLLTLTGSYTYLHAVVTRSFASSALRPAINSAYPGQPIGAYSPLVGGRPFRRAPNSGSVAARLAKGPGHAAVAAYFVGRQDASTFLSDGFFGNALLLPNRDLAAGYSKIDVSGGYRLHPRIDLTAGAENVLNRRYEAALGYPALPRTVRVGFSVTLGGDRREGR